MCRRLVVRVTPSRPFENCGTDSAGPYWLKDEIVKFQGVGYACLLVCLELAIELTTEAFLNCLKRFFSRRGLCRNIYSDNGSNFIGANNELKKLSIYFKNKKNTEFFKFK